jgi:hypothetical protein
MSERRDPHQIPIKDFVKCGIELRASCRSCERSRIIHGGLLQRNFAPDTSIHPHALNQFGKRLKCGNCGAHWPKLELVIDEVS